MEFFLLTRRRFAGTIKRSETLLQRYPVQQEDQVAMNKVAPQFNFVGQDVPLVHSERLSRKLAGVSPVLSEELIHELRQPLGVIDSLAYYLELTAADEKICEHLEHIRAMVSQANRILERASSTRQDATIGGPFLSGS